MKQVPVDVIRGSRNLYRELGRKNADGVQCKAILAAEISKAREGEGLSVRDAQARTGIAAAHFSRIRSVDLGRFIADRGERNATSLVAAMS